MHALFELVNQWFVSGPSLEAKRQKNKNKHAKKQKNTEVASPEPAPDTVEDPVDPSGLVADEQDEDVAFLSVTDAESVCGDSETETMHDNDDENEDNTRAVKKRRIEAEVPPVVQEVAAYIDITPPARTAKSKEATTTVGPFMFTVETPHNTFLQSIVSAASTNDNTFTTASINTAQLSWKFNVPANDRKKPLSTLVGYQALISSLRTRIEDTKSRAKDNTITLFMPPLLHQVSCVFHIWNGHMCLDLHYLQVHPHNGDEEELLSGPAGSSVREQQVRHYIIYFFPQLFLIFIIIGHHRAGICTYP